MFDDAVVRWRLLAARWIALRERLREEPESGYTTETVVVTALLVILAIAVMAIIAVKVMERVNQINLG